MNSRVEKAKEWIDEISSHNSQDLDKILFFMNLMLTKRDLYYENVRLEKEVERLTNIINDIHNGLEKIIEQGYDYNEINKIAIELINKIEISGSDKE